MRIIFMVLLLVSAAWAQETFTAPDGSMAPILSSSTVYFAVDPFRDTYLRNHIVVFTQDSTTVARKIVGIPGDKELTEDSDFALRGQSTWRGDFYVGKAVCWLTGELPSTPPTRTSHLNSDNVLLDVSFAVYDAASALGDSTYYVHALTRPDISEGATRTLAQGADSREWGTVHARDFLYVIPEDQLDE